MLKAADTVRPSVTPLEALLPFAIVGLEGISNTIAIVDARSGEELAVLKPADFHQAWVTYGMSDPMASKATLMMNPRLARADDRPSADALKARKGLIDRALAAWISHARWGWTFFYAMGALAGFGIRGLVS